MLLILEIILTIKAWRKGYKAWALVPVGLVMLIGFMIGASDPTLTEANLYSLIWLDILAIIALGLMIAAAKKPVPISSEESLEYPDETEEAVVNQAVYPSITTKQLEPASSVN